MSLNSNRFNSQQTCLQGLLYQIGCEQHPIDLNPEYQRGIVWTLEQQQKIVDTVLRQYPIPALFFRDKPGFCECVDGKQRLTSLKKFKKNELSIPNDGYTDQKNEEKELIFYDDLSPLYKGIFNNAQITRIDLVNDWSDADIYDLFHRVQNGKMLSNGELFNAMLYNSYINDAKRFVASEQSRIKQIIHKSCESRHQFLELVIALCTIEKDDSFNLCTPAKMSKFVDNQYKSEQIFDPNPIKNYIGSLLKAKKIKHPHWKSNRRYFTKWDFILGFKIFLPYKGKNTSTQQQIMLKYIEFIKNTPKSSEWSPNSFGKACLIKREKICLLWM